MQNKTYWSLINATTTIIITNRQKISDTIQGAFVQSFTKIKTLLRHSPCYFKQQSEQRNAAKYCSNSKLRSIVTRSFFRETSGCSKISMLQSKRNAIEVYDAEREEGVPFAPRIKKR